MSTSTIRSVRGREIIDSRGRPTIEVICELSGGEKGVASVPSGISKGSHEALELRDNNPKRFNGLGVLTAVANVNGEMNDALRGQKYDQEGLDAALIALDGSPNKSRLGANAILGVSLAFARAKAQEGGLELYEYLGTLAGVDTFTLPQPLFNVINGGKHADSGLDIQEYMIAPIRFSSLREKVRVAAEIISALRDNLKANGFLVSVGDEGGFAPRLSSNEEALERMVESVRSAGYSVHEVKFGIDAAASSFCDGTAYRLKIAGRDQRLTSEALIDWYEKLAAAYPLVSVEDGLAEEDWQGFASMMRRLGGKVEVVGDDLLVTNVDRIQLAVEKRAVSSVLIKPNQIGTLTQTIQAILLTKKQGWKPFVSHRSGETTDTFIADLAVGLSCDYFKAGSLTRGERVAKYNRLMEIEERLILT